MIFKGVLDGKPYPEHGLSPRDWSRIPPRQVRLSELVTTTTVLALDRLLSEDSTFFGDLFPHAVSWRGDMYLEDGLHRAVRSALRNRTILHCRVYEYDTPLPPAPGPGEAPPRSPLATLSVPPSGPIPAGPVPLGPRSGRTPAGPTSGAMTSGPASGPTHAGPPSGPTPGPDAENYGRHAARPRRGH
ncbi:type II toxin-antitoxin system VapB family antitoxin [Tsukamurella sp. 8F]|nr:MULTISPECIES: type II toxin-antitoxin system VapB family antitoxin [unclassified Tsukamurella]MDF0530022.1 type II toxin-antitoxin system VapB family antitoxin [Tsukamurella sp. 8J]MDF0587206.1 type II toxin-antitoxin system VapB family antitoxin [Tsukamurella sp. 8F]